MTAPPINLLVAWPYLTERMIGEIAALGDHVRLLVDSGAFTAFRAGKSLAVADYCTFLDRLPVKPWRYFNLDVIGDTEASERNYQYMLDRGFRPVPIFTRGAPLDVLDRMFDTSEVVGIGGLVVAKNRPYRYVKAVMQHLAGRPVHLLGFVDPEWLPYFKPYSCDASSFTRANRYGYVDVYLGSGQFAHIFRSRATTHQPSEPIMRAIAGAGFDPWEMLKFENWSKPHGIGRWLAVRSWVQYSIDIDRLHGIKLFLAGAREDLSVIVAAYRAITEGADYEAARRATIKQRIAA